MTKEDLLEKETSSNQAEPSLEREGGGEREKGVINAEKCKMNPFSLIFLCSSYKNARTVNY